MKVRHEAVALARDLFLDIYDKKTCIVRAHLAVRGDSSYLFVKIAVKSEAIWGQHKFDKRSECVGRPRWIENRALVEEVG